MDPTGGRLKSGFGWRNPIARGRRAQWVRVFAIAQAVLALGCLAAPTAGAQSTGAAAHGAVQATPRGASIVVSLISIGQGDLTWERFGHNALRFRDTTSGADVVYNWGLFDFSEKGFMVRFLQGKGRYAMGGASTARFLALYEPEDRHVWEQVLNLSNEQKALAIDLVVENEKPQNIYYDYNYYLDNCSTRIRDLLDKVLGGQLRGATDSIGTSDTYRSHTRRLLTDDKLPYFGVQLVLGHAADEPISRWDEMFLPVRMMRYLNDVRVRGTDGQMQPFVTSTREISRPVRRTPELEEVVPQTLTYFAIGLTLALAMSLLAMAGSRGSRAGVTIFAGLSLVWSVLAGIAGTLALCMWLFTQHTFMYRNETILLMNPLHLLLAILLPAAVLRARLMHGAMLLVRAIAFLSLLGMALYLLPGLGQANPEMLALALPPNLALLGGLIMIRGFWGQTP